MHRTHLWIFPETGIAVKNVHFSLLDKKKMLERDCRDLRRLLEMPMNSNGYGH